MNFLYLGHSAEEPDLLEAVIQLMVKSDLTRDLYWYNETRQQQQWKIGKERSVQNCKLFLYSYMKE